MTIGTIDNHPEAPKLPADPRAGGIDCTGNAIPFPVFPHERAAFYQITLLRERGLAVSIFTFNMGEKKFIFYPVPAVIIAAGELAFNFYKIPETRAAFPAPGTIKCHHIVYGMLAGR
jgi:hypothetical protein